MEPGQICLILVIGAVALVDEVMELRLGLQVQGVLLVSGQSFPGDELGIQGVIHAALIAGVDLHPLQALDLTDQGLQCLGDDGNGFFLVHTLFQGVDADVLDHGSISS